MGCMMLDKVQKSCAVLMVVLLLGVCAVRYGPYIPLPDWGGIVVPITSPEAAVIIRETGVTQPLSPALVRLYAMAPAAGAIVIDPNTLGPGKKPSPKLKPYLDAANGKPLPVLVLRWAGGKLTVEPLPSDFEALKKRIGK